MWSRLPIWMLRALLNPSYHAGAPTTFLCDEATGNVFASPDFGRHWQLFAVIR